MQSLCGNSYHIHKTIQQLTAGGCNGSLYDCYAQYTEKVMKSNQAHIHYKINNCLFPFQHVSPFHTVPYKEKCLENIPRYRSASSRQLAAPYIHRHQNMFSKQASLEVMLLQVEHDEE